VDRVDRKVVDRVDRKVVDRVDQKVVDLVAQKAVDRVDLVLAAVNTWDRHLHQIPNACSITPWSSIKTPMDCSAKVN
jgi:hypothetical protein